MKPRHAAALALFGWTLVLAPHPPPGLIILDPDKSAVYKSAEECHQALHRLADPTDSYPDWEIPPTMSRWIAQCKCVQESPANTK